MPSLVVHSPAGVGDVVLLKEVQPELCFGVVEGTATMRLAEAPLRHEESDSVADGLLGLLSD